MKIGKTVQVIAFICSLVQDGAPGPFLVVAPLSTLTNWCTEFARFAPSVSRN
jgi:ATP-dependent DNA helicase